MNINFAKGGGLGSNSTYYQTVTYSSYRNALSSDSITNNDTTAMALLPSSIRDPVVNSRNINVKTANLRAVGINSNPPTGEPDGYVTLNTDLTFPGSSGSSLQYSLLAVIQHETNELLGMGSGLPNSTTRIFPEDLFRYSSSGARSYTISSSATAFFSIDGTTDLAQFHNSNDGADYGDWESNPLPAGVSPKVQDAYATPFATPSMGVELIALDAIGYDVANVWIGAGSTNNWSTGLDWAATPSNGSNLIFAGTTRLANSNNSLTSVGSILFDSSAGAFTLSGNALTISGGITNSSSSTQTINLNLTLGAAQQFNASSGNLVVNGTINNGGNALTVTGSSNTSLGGVVSGGGGLVKTGNGTLTVSGNSTYGGGTTVSAGTLIVGHTHGLGTGGLTINSTAKTTLQSGLSGPVQLPSLTLAGGTNPTATLDITNNNMIVHNGNLATLTAQVKKGLNISGTLWTGAGITSSTAAADSNGLTAVGVISNDDGSGGTIYATWPVGADAGGAVSVTNTDKLIKYTYFGDADLNGSVDNSTDYLLWPNGFSSNGSLSGWFNGDFDYSGTIDNSTDYLLWANGFSSQGSPLVGSVQPVPEPSALVLAAMGLAGVGIKLVRRRPTACTRH